MSDEPNTEMSVALPNDSQLTTEIESIIDEGDLEALTRKQVLRKLEDLFNSELSEKKKFIYAEVQRLVQKKVDEEDEGEDEEEKDASEEEEEEQPAPKRRKTRGGGRQSKKKKPKGNRRPNAKPSGIMQPRKLSEKMAAFMGKAQAARVEVAKHITAYVREHELQDEADRRRIHLDDKLFDLFGVKEMTYFNMQKYISPHIESGSKRKKGGVSGLKKPMLLSEELAAVLDTKVSSRSQVVKGLWAYIKTNELQNPEDGREILCDEKLRAVFNEDKVHMFTMNKALSRHLSPAPEPEPKSEESAAEEAQGDGDAAPAEGGDSAPSSSSSAAPEDAETSRSSAEPSSELKPEPQANGTPDAGGDESPPDDATSVAATEDAEDTPMADADVPAVEASVAADDSPKKEEGADEA